MSNEKSLSLGKRYAKKNMTGPYVRPQPYGGNSKVYKGMPLFADKRWKEHHNIQDYTNELIQGMSGIGTTRLLESSAAAKCKLSNSGDSRFNASKSGTSADHHTGATGLKSGTSAEATFTGATGPTAPVNVTGPTAPASTSADHTDVTGIKSDRSVEAAFTGASGPTAPVSTSAEADHTETDATGIKSDTSAPAEDAFTGASGPNTKNT